MWTPLSKGMSCQLKHTWHHKRSIQGSHGSHDVQNVTLHAGTAVGPQQASACRDGAGWHKVASHQAVTPTQAVADLQWRVDGRFRVTCAFDEGTVLTKLSEGSRRMSCASRLCTLLSTPLPGAPSGSGRPPCGHVGGRGQTARGELAGAAGGSQRSPHPCRRAICCAWCWPLNRSGAWWQQGWP